MIRIVDRFNAHDNAHALQQHFANRHAIFVKELGWSNLKGGPDFEKDQYDDEHTVYALSLDSRDRVIGGIRFYPTSLPHMISEEFAYLMDGPIVASPDIYEVTRSHLLPDFRDKKHYLELMCAIQEVGLYLSAKSMTSIVRTLRLPIILETGLAVTPLGEPTLIDGVSNLAVAYEIDARILQRMNKRRGTTQSVLEPSPLLARRAG